VQEEKSGVQKNKIVVHVKTPVVQKQCLHKPHMCIPTVDTFLRYVEKYHLVRYGTFSCAIAL